MILIHESCAAVVLSVFWVFLLNAIPSDDTAQATWHATGTIELDSHIYSLAFGPEYTLVTGDAGYVRVWDVETGTERQFYKYSPANTRGWLGITYAPDNSWVSFRELNGIHLAFGEQYLKGGRPVDYGVGIKGPPIIRLAISLDGKTYAFQRAIGRARAATKTNDLSVSVTDVANRGQPMQREVLCKGHTDDPFCAAFSPDGGLLVSGAADKTARVWDPTSGKELHRLKGHTDTVLVVTFSPKGDRIVTGGKDGLIKQWNPVTGAELSSVNGRTAVRCVDFTPDGKTLVSGHEAGTLRIWDVAQGKESATLADHTGTVFAVDFSRDGAILASGGQDKVVRLWKRQQ